MSDSNFMGGQMAGLPLFEKDKEETAKPRGEQVPQQRRKSDTHTPQDGTLDKGYRTVGPLASDDSMRVVSYMELENGAVFMREIKPNTYITYTKAMHDKSWPEDYQVLIFKRHEKVYLKQSAQVNEEIEAMAEVLRQETRDFLGSRKK